MATHGGFEWISTTTASHGQGVSKSDRLTIRRQAIKRVSIARRQSGNHGQINLGQFPVFIRSGQPWVHCDVPRILEGSRDTRTAYTGSSLNTKEIVALRTEGNKDEAQARLISQPSWISPLGTHQSTIDSLKSRTGVDILGLSTLTVSHIYHAVSDFLSLHPNRVKLLHEPRQSYLQHISQRYGRTKCLDCAVDALVLKVREALDPPGSTCHTLVVASIGRALHTLQSAIKDPTMCVESDVLCAAEVFSIIEVLSLPGESAWMHHISGAAQLVQVRGTSRFESDYDKDMLLSLVGPIVCEAIRKNETCFLQQRQWQEVLKSSETTATKEISERSRVTILFRRLMTFLPGLFRDVSSVCYGCSCAGRTVPSLISDICSFYEKMRQLYHYVKVQVPSSYSQSVGIDLVYEILATSLGALSMASRLMNVLGIAMQDDLEQAALVYALEIKMLEADVGPSNGRLSFYLSQKGSVADSVLSTSTVWRTVPGHVIEAGRFEMWCQALQRLTCNHPF
ncbi:hypothetical protein B0I35DRAFT_438001 [Stachybotrys elegans]|uniref:Uncharacterized protein n=1 Tax=Stachybotrys elegans TaxID=80388 RepID=A0A8K0SL97_9HYPO|nr:hypothetical protein B0I35DRAFT_438001 [Stachybotrys elegans]